MAKILIIEDNPTNLQLMVYLLQAYGHTALEAIDGTSGLARAAEQPDLILCDIQLPDLDGYQIARYLKSHPDLRSIPVVAVTALAMVGDRDRVLEAGFDGYLPKPIEPELFVGQVTAFIPSVPRGALTGQFPSPSVAAEYTLPDSGTAGQKGTVLVVDDLMANLDLARAILEPFGYRTLPALGLKKGLALARSEPCDLILSDVCMGSESGLDFLRTVLADPQLQSIPVMFVTSTCLDTQVREQALAWGAARYLIRPLDPEVLLAEVEACLRERNGSRGDHPGH